MGANRYYIPIPLLEGETVSLEEEEFHHLSRVMRVKIGEEVEVTNGEGDLADAELVSLEKRKGFLKLTKVSHRCPSLPPLILIQAIPKLPILEWIIQKGTEIGVTEFILFPSERSEKKDLSAQQQKRLDQIMIGALKQCDRLDLPKLSFISSLKEISLPEASVFFGDLNANVSPLPNVKPPYAIFIGPEKGFTANESETIKKQFGAVGIRFHPYTLRAETAAIASLSLFAAQSLQFSPKQG